MPLLLSALTACHKPLPAPQELGKLVVATRKEPVSYQINSQGVVSGFEHDLVVEFARELGLEVHFLVVSDPAQIDAVLAQGRAHMAAAALVRANGAPAQETLRFSRPIRPLQQLLVQHEDAPPLTRLADLAGREVTVLAGSPEASALARLQPHPPGLRIVEKKRLGEMALLRRVQDRRVALAVVDSANFEIGANFYPGLQASLALPEESALVWAFPENGDAELLDQANAFIERIGNDGTLDRLEDRYFGHTHRLNQNDVVSFLKRMQSVLPRYRASFIEAQQLYGIDWRLIAALAYQESHWDPLATSYTNVRGMMMLTEDTADRLRVSDRLDPHQSILAGTRYLVELREQLPAQTPEPDRTWLALAAYNLGMGHLNGARFIASLVKRDPDSWYEMKQVLPLLARPEYYQRLKSGAARGGEAVIMTENIRTYYDILRRYQSAVVSPRMFAMRPDPSASTAQEWAATPDADAGTDALSAPAR